MIMQYIEAFKMWIFLVLIVIIIGLSITVKMQSLKLDAAKAEAKATSALIDNQNQSVKMLAEKGEELHLQVLSAENHAKQQHTEQQKLIQKLSKEKVPTDCKEAVKWSVTKVPAITGGW